MGSAGTYIHPLRTQEMTEPEATPPVEAQAEGEGEVQEESKPPACMDLTDYIPKVDVFDHVNVMSEKAEKIEGCPNYRQVVGFPIYGTGQPTEDGFLKVLEKLSSTGEGHDRICWFNMRKEPVVYVNGKSFAPRSPEDLHRNLDIYFSVDELNYLEVAYKDIVTEAAEKEGGKLIKIICLPKTLWIANQWRRLFRRRRFTDCSRC